MNQNQKFALATGVSWLMATIILAMMTTQHGQAMPWSRLAVVLILAVVAVGARYFKTVLTSYVTMFVMLYLGVLSLGGIINVTPRWTGLGILIQGLSLIGVLAAGAGLVIGFQTRTDARRNWYQKKDK
ncbi:hypothetical protein [Limosilactobacillus equigenerosi]|uniref:Integral membrane protein n=2 Tax=Limosilactobacillus TaxID=2742598 RepID=A0A0R1UP81_9LACO|nr:hypothetical protein [Limosilactobacillus equigenerosi]KRL95057.1 hypothetical protein FC21_GL001104 [Limosilactobacillus equigenerosi DSM 18793 = JCM 14505]